MPLDVYILVFRYKRHNSNNWPFNCWPLQSTEYSTYPRVDPQKHRRVALFLSTPSDGHKSHSNNSPFSIKLDADLYYYFLPQSQPFLSPEVVVKCTLLHYFIVSSCPVPPTFPLFVIHHTFPSSVSGRWAVKRFTASTRDAITSARQPVCLASLCFFHMDVVKVAGLILWI